MNSGISHSQAPSARGFTLLEMVAVLSMLAFFTTWAVFSVTNIKTETRLRKATNEIETLIKRARTIAVIQDRPYQVSISAQELSLAPKHMTKDSLDIKNITDTKKTDSDIKYEIKHWQSVDWITIKKNIKVVITLHSSALVEPISMRCTIGKSWLMQELHPLTGGVRNEEMNIQE